MTRDQKKALRFFLQNHYSDDKLAALLAHAKDKKLVYASCCCFIGVATAQHPLATYGTNYDIVARFHYSAAQKLAGAREAEMAYMELAYEQEQEEGGNDARCRLVVPLIRAEMKRRERLKHPISSGVEDAIQRVCQ